MILEGLELDFKSFWTNLSTLILTEKPSVARDFAAALGIPLTGKNYYSNNKFKVTWAIGHLYTPFDPDNYNKSLKKWSLESLPILPEQFKYKANSKTKNQLQSILKLLNDSNTTQLIVATDAGREGELIARTIISHSKFKGDSFRFWTSEALTKAVILKELKHLKPLSQYNRLYYAGKARQVADWLVGMNLTRAITVKNNDLYSVGRVQTAVLSLLVKRANEITNFKTQKYFTLNGHFNFEDKTLSAKWFDPNKKERADWIDSKKEVNSIKDKCLNKSAIIQSVSTKDKSLRSPQLYSLTELQKHANRVYGFSAERTLKIAQDLYEKYKCLSYPRTDSRYLGESNLTLVEDLLGQFENSYEQYFAKIDRNKISLNNKYVFNNKGLTDHHAIIPTDNFSGPLKSAHEKIYHLVVKRFASVFSLDFKYQETIVIAQCEHENFKAKGKVVKEIGFKILEKGENDLILPKLIRGESGVLNKIDIKEQETQPPLDYTEATLLHHMSYPATQLEDKNLKGVFKNQIGLGTQATRASIIETLLKRKYIERSGKFLVAQPKGHNLIKFVQSIEHTSKISKADETARWEKMLDDISRGDLNLGLEFVDNIKQFTSLCVEEVKSSTQFNSNEKRPIVYGKSLGQCPLCKNEILDNKKSYSCSNWKNGCKFTVWKIMSGKKITQNQVISIIKNGKTAVLKGFKSKTGNKFSAKLVLSEKGVQFEF